MLTRRALLVRGQALAAGMRLGVARAGVPLLLDTALVDLVLDNGRVSGVMVEHGGERRVLRARHGVVLACGGFEHNAQMRAKYQREPICTDWTVGAKANTGDGINAGERLGAALDLMDDAWWGPSIPLTGGPWFCLAERTLPGGIMINDRGKRFMNEAAPYVEATHNMYGGEFGHGDGPGENIPCWMVIDQGYRNRYVFAGLTPKQPFPGRWYKAGALLKGNTIAELAEQMGVPADTLVGDRRAIQRLRQDGQGRGLRPRRLGLRQVLRGPADEESEPRRDQGRAVLRGDHGPGRPGYEGWALHRCRWAGAA